MRRLLVILTVLLAVVTSGCGNGSPLPLSTSNPPPSDPPPAPVLPADPDQAADFLLAQMTQNEKLQLVHGALTIENPTGPHGAAEWVPGIARLKIPDLLYSDGPVGAYAGLGPATALPSSMACAATWDLEEPVSTDR